MKTLRILHVASFIGNIGDNANHSGARSRMKINFPGTELIFTELEIRRFYRKWNDLAFDETFIRLANTFDLVIIGGGNYFELWVEHSRTGTTVDLPPELLAQLQSPVVFYGLGLDPEKGYSQSTIAKFKAFLDVVLHEERFLVSVRNDGSLNNAYRLLGPKYASMIHRIPDGGFFTKVEEQSHPELSSQGKTLVINLAGDMLDKRFPCAEEGFISFDDFLEQFAAYIESLLRMREDLSIVLAPHIHRDLQILAALLEKMDDRLCRTRITVAPFLTGPASQSYIFDLYRRADLVMGNRFHANVCSIGLGVPSIGLANYPKIAAMYEELAMPERAVTINRTGFVEQLDALVWESLNNPFTVKTRYAQINSQLTFEIDMFQTYMRHWLERLACRSTQNAIA
jgi:polysaccharide pyruvyl transferase WcaK-like protein